VQTISVIQHNIEPLLQFQNFEVFCQCNRNSGYFDIKKNVSSRIWFRYRAAGCHANSGSQLELVAMPTAVPNCFLSATQNLPWQASLHSSLKQRMKKYWLCGWCLAVSCYVRLQYQTSILFNATTQTMMNEIERTWQGENKECWKYTNEIWIASARPIFGPSRSLLGSLPIRWEALQYKASV